MIPEWSTFLIAMTLALVRVSGMVVFAPFFSSTALPVRAKAVLVLAIAYLLAPLQDAVQAGPKQHQGAHQLEKLTHQRRFAVSSEQTHLVAAQTNLMQADVATVATQLALAKAQQAALQSVIAQLGSGSLFDKL